MFQLGAGPSACARGEEKEEAQGRGDEGEQKPRNGPHVGQEALIACADQKRATTHGVEIEQGGEYSETDRGGKTTAEVRHSAPEMDDDLTAMRRERGKEQRSQRTGPYRAGAAHLLGDGAIEASGSGTVEELIRHCGSGGRRARGKVCGEVDQAPQERAEQGCLPVPPPQQKPARVGDDLADCSGGSQSGMRGSADPGRLGLNGLRHPIKLARARDNDLTGAWRFR